MNIIAILDPSLTLRMTGLPVILIIGKPVIWIIGYTCHSERSEESFAY